MENPDDLFKIGVDSADITQFGYINVKNRDGSSLNDQDRLVLPDLHASFSNEFTNVLSLNSSNESLADQDFLNAHSINDSFKILSINVGGLQKRLHCPDFERFIHFFP